MLGVTEHMRLAQREYADNDVCGVFATEHLCFPPQALCGAGRKSPRVPVFSTPGAEELGALGGSLQKATAVATKGFDERAQKVVARKACRLVLAKVQGISTRYTIIFEPPDERR